MYIGLERAFRYAECLSDFSVSLATVFTRQELFGGSEAIGFSVGRVFLSHAVAHPFQERTGPTQHVELFRGVVVSGFKLIKLLGFDGINGKMGCATAALFRPGAMPFVGQEMLQ